MSLVQRLLLFANSFFAFSVVAHGAELPPPQPKTATALALTDASDEELHQLGVKRKVLGGVNLPSGKLVGIDPIALIERGSHFVEVFPVGASTVNVYVTKDKINGERVALAEIRFTNDKVTEWKLAQVEDVPPPSTLRDTDYGMIVEGAMGSYMSAEFLTDLSNAAHYPSGGSFYSEYLFHNLKNSEHAVSFLFQQPEFLSGNAAIFETGDSDGVYPSFIGYNSIGAPVKLVTTFYLLEYKGS